MSSPKTAVSVAAGMSLGDSLRENRSPPNESLERDEQINQVKKALAEIPEDLRTPLLLVE